MTHNERITAVHNFWFGAGDWLIRWFGSNTEIDEEISRRFAPLVELGFAGKLGAWAATPQGTLALLIVLDQFPRNLFRGQSRAFAGAERAELLAVKAIAQGDDQRVPWHERAFFYLPLEHAEDAHLQDESVRLFQALEKAAPPEHQAMAKRFVHAAVRHHDCVARFGRFPARNAALSRQTSEAEGQFLRENPAGF